MKFTEALILGSLNSKQAFNAYNLDGHCALLTAAVAAGIEREKHSEDWIKAMSIWPWLDTKVDLTCPCEDCNRRMFSIFTLIYHLNDTHRWPRPRIAEWAKQLEAEYDVPVPTPITEEVLCEVK